ncbi:MAG: pentapeptide repeat-containing protein [Gammaproteobacteria bacterium]
MAFAAGQDTKSMQEKRLPGTFRGDWGESPVYARGDRVNHEGAIYLSLENDNQSQSPSQSPAYWRSLKQLPVADMAACLSPSPGANLSQCDFSDTASLKDRLLGGSNLSNTKLSGELGRADLRGANLSGATVVGSLVIGPDTRLQHADLSKLHADGNNPLIADDADLSQTNFKEASLYGAKLSHADLSGAQLTAATLTGAELSGGRLEKAELSKANLSYANLTGAAFSDAVLNQADLSEAHLSRSDFSNADLNQANLAGADLDGSDLSGADLRGANLIAAKNAELALVDTLTDFTSAICPDGITVDGIQATTCIGHGF